MDDLEDFYNSDIFEDIVTEDFKRHDKDGSGFIEISELKASLQEFSDNLESFKKGAG